MKTKFNSNNDRQLFIIGGTAMDAALELSNTRSTGQGGMGRITLRNSNNGISIFE